jgi:hypothetical protein
MHAHIMEKDYMRLKLEYSLAATAKLVTSLSRWQSWRGESDGRRRWRRKWATWLPHTRERAQPDGTSPSVLVADDFDDLADVVERELTRIREAQVAQRGAVFASRSGKPASRHLVMVIDRFNAGSRWVRDPLGRALIEVAGLDTGITVIALVASQADEPSRVGARRRTSARTRARRPGPRLMPPS